MTSIAVLSYLYGNIFPMVFVRTPFSMAMVAIATVVPCVGWSVVLIRRLKAEIGNPELSDRQLLVRAIGGLVVAAVGTYAVAFAPGHCSNSKCEVGVILFGPIEFIAFWWASFWSGWVASFSLLGLYGVACRRLARDR